MDKHTIASALNETFGSRWSFEIVGHTTVGATIEVIGELRADGQRVRETGRVNGTGTLGERLEAASNTSLEHCARALLNGALPERETPTPTQVIAPRTASTSPSVARPAPAKGDGPKARTHAPSPAIPSSAPRQGELVTRQSPAAISVPASSTTAPSGGTGQRKYPYEHLDPVTLRVVGGAFNAIAKEMAHVLYRMSYSSIIRESEDLGCGIFDMDGLELCESESTPMHIGSLPWYLRGIRKRLGDDIHDGDVIIHNHPYYGASHTPDLAVIVPIFYQDRLLGFSACTAHLLDMGGAAPGINVDVVDVFAEAKLFNAIKLYRKGVRNEDIWFMLQDNVRTPDMDTSDIEAMIASVQLGRDRFLKFVEKYSEETVMGTAYYWMDYSERMLRAEIEKLPDGEYHADGWLDDDGKNRDKPLKVNVTVRIKGGEITIDLTGSADEVETGFNVPFEGSLIVACNYIVRTLLLDEVAFEDFVPQNEGIFRPVKVVAPKGSIFNPNFPRACFSRFAQIQRVLDCVI